MLWMKRHARIPTLTISPKESWRLWSTGKDRSSKRKTALRQGDQGAGREGTQRKRKKGKAVNEK